MEAVDEEPLRGNAAANSRFYARITVGKNTPSLAHTR